jgi:hypothetical protein
LWRSNNIYTRGLGPELSLNLYSLKSFVVMFHVTGEHSSDEPGRAGPESSSLRYYVSASYFGMCVKIHGIYLTAGKNSPGSLSSRRSSNVLVWSGAAELQLGNEVLSRVRNCLRFEHGAFLEFRSCSLLEHSSKDKFYSTSFAFERMADNRYGPPTRQRSQLVQKCKTTRPIL